jgi:uncharacterized protein (DUF362 family)
VVAFAARRVKKRAICAMTRSTIILALFLWLAFAHAAQARQDLSFSRDRSRVVVVENSRSVVAFSPVGEVVSSMVNTGLTTLTGAASPSAAWRSLVSPQETIGIKVVSGPGATTGTRPAVVAAVVEGLITAGIQPGKILIWDRNSSDLHRAGFFGLAQRYGVRVVGSADEGYDESVFYDSPLLGRLVWGDHEFGRRGEEVGRRSFLSSLVTREITRIINITPLLNHNETYVHGNLSSLALGSVDNAMRFLLMPEQLAQVIPEIYAFEQLSDRVVLNIVDGLICQYIGGERPSLHYSTMLRQLRFSTDPVALDVLSIHELELQRRLAGLPSTKVDWQIYSNAALLELGKFDLRQIDVTRVNDGP